MRVFTGKLERKRSVAIALLLAMVLIVFLLPQTDIWKQKQSTTRLNNQLTALGESFVAADFARISQMLSYSTDYAISGGQAVGEAYLTALFSEGFKVAGYQISQPIMEEHVPAATLTLNVRNASGESGVRLFCSQAEDKVKIDYAAPYDIQPANQEDSQFLLYSFSSMVGYLNGDGDFMDAKEEIARRREQVYGDVEAEDFPRRDILSISDNAIELNLTELQPAPPQTLLETKEFEMDYEGQRYHGLLKLIETRRTTQSNQVLATYSGTLQLEEVEGQPQA